VSPSTAHLLAYQIKTAGYKSLGIGVLFSRPYSYCFYSPINTCNLLEAALQHVLTWEVQQVCCALAEEICGQHIGPEEHAISLVGSGVHG
jgi:hypothetical protein